MAVRLALFLRLLVLVSAARVQQPLQLRPAPLEQGNGCRPSQVHLALGKDATQMHISWKTASPDCPSEVLYQQTGPRRSSQLHSLRAGVDGTAIAVGYSFLLSERDMCSEPALSNAFSLYLHRVKLRDLVPGKLHLYQVAGSNFPLSFFSAPQPDPNITFTFLAFGDMGDAVHEEAKSPGAAATLVQLHEEVDSSQTSADIVLHVGDISYANGNPAIWDSFMDGIEPIASRIPYMVAIGNHEYGYKQGPGAAIDPSGAAGPYQPTWGNYGSDSRGECGIMTARRFHMPKNMVADNAPFWYGFNYGSVHFTVISTEHALDKGSRQYKWLEQELAAVDRCFTPWLVVLLHRPMYVVYPHKSNREVGQHIGDSIEHLLLQHRVDLTIAGHVHSYYRSCPVYEDNCIPDHDLYENWPTLEGSSVADVNSSSSNVSSSNRRYSCDTNGRCKHGIVHFVIGSAGHRLSAVEQGQEEWCVKKVRKWGYGRFSVRGSQSLIVQYVSSESGEVLDSVEVRATGARNAVCNST